MFLRAFSRGEQTLEIKSHARLKGDVKKNGENVFSGRVFLLVSRLMMSLFEYMAGWGVGVSFVLDRTGQLKNGLRENKAFTSESPTLHV